jgi:hypothetical protein
MLSHDSRWSLPRGNTLVPSGWQATLGSRAEIAEGQDIVKSCAWGHVAVSGVVVAAQCRGLDIIGKGKPGGRCDVDETSEGELVGTRRFPTSWQLTFRFDQDGALSLLTRKSCR